MKHSAHHQDFLLDDYSLHDINETELLIRHCPRMYPWSERSLDSIFHPNVAHQALRHGKRRNSTVLFSRVHYHRRHDSTRKQPHVDEQQHSDNDDARADDEEHHGMMHDDDVDDDHNSYNHTDQGDEPGGAEYCPLCGQCASRANPTLSSPTFSFSEASRLRTKLNMMPPEVKWDIISTMYNRVRSQKRFEWHLSLITNYIQESYVVNQAIDRWWSFVKNEHSHLERKSLVILLSRIYEALTPPNRACPMSRMFSTQMDCQSFCAKTKTINLPTFRRIMLELCDNFVNMNVCEVCGSIPDEYNPLRLAQWGNGERSFLRIDLSKDNVSNEDRLNAGLAMKSAAFAQFLNDLYLKICGGRSQSFYRKPSRRISDPNPAHRYASSSAISIPSNQRNAQRNAPFMKARSLDSIEKSPPQPLNSSASLQALSTLFNLPPLKIDVPESSPVWGAVEKDSHMSENHRKSPKLPVLHL